MPKVALSAAAPTFTVTVCSVANVTPPVVAVTVTCVAPASSATLAGFAFSFRTGWSSSLSVMLVPVTVSPVEVPATVIVSSRSTILSSVGVSVNVPFPLVAPAAIVMVKSLTAS